MCNRALIRERPHVTLLEPTMGWTHAVFAFGATSNVLLSSSLLGLGVCDELLHVAVPLSHPREVIKTVNECVRKF